MQELASKQLREHNSLAVVANCQRLFALEQINDLPALTQLKLEQPLMLGAGTNILLRADYPGDVILNRLQGRQIIDATDKHAFVRIQAGADWHKTVLWALDKELSGIENLALIPGTAGAAPVQNIGAYGVNLSDSLELVEVWDRQRKQALMLKAANCKLGYRDSLFKQQIDRYWILNLTLKLSRKPKLRLNYSGIKQQLLANGIENPRPEDVVTAVCQLRKRKLPDPAKHPNAGSFFKNPMVTDTQLKRLLNQYPDLPHWPETENQTKLAAAWLIERCGFKGKRVGAAGIATNHALVLVNYGQATGSELWQLAATVQAAVLQRFEVKLEPEPRILP